MCCAFRFSLSCVILCVLINIVLSATSNITVTVPPNKNCSSSNGTVCGSAPMRTDKKEESKNQEGPAPEKADSNLLMHGLYVVISVTVLAAAYIVYRAIRLRRKTRQSLGSSSRRSRKDNVELHRLTDEQYDDEDDSVLYDRSTEIIQHS